MKRILITLNILTAAFLTTVHSQTKTVALQYTIDFNKTMSFARNDIFPYRASFTDWNLGAKLRFSQNNSNIYAIVGNRGAGAGIALFAPIIFNVPFTKILFSKTMIGVYGEVRHNWRTPEYVSLIKVPQPGATNVSWIDNLIGKATDAINPEAYNQTRNTFAAGIRLQRACKFGDNLQVIPYLCLENRGRLEQLNFKIGFQLALCASKINEGAKIQYEKSKELRTLAKAKTSAKTEASEKQVPKSVPIPKDYRPKYKVE